MNFAVLIDSDNVSHTYVKPMLAEIARYGTPTIKRIYGDWTQPEAAGWRNELLENAITPIQQYRYTTGKNCTDSTLIIDAMDILYSGRVSGFCIVSSDSDFTRLATRLREAGMTVIGIGEKKTPAPFIAACDRFIYLEIIVPQPEAEEEKKAPAPQASVPKKVSKKVRKLVRDSVNDVADEEGWASLGEVGTMLLRKAPDFDSRAYGFAKLKSFIESLGIFEINKRNTSIYIRDVNFVQTEKEKKKPAAQANNRKEVPEEIRKFVRDTVNDVADEDGWVSLGYLGHVLVHKAPDFDNRTYGYAKLKSFIESLGMFEIERRDLFVYIRDMDFVQTEK